MVPTHTSEKIYKVLVKLCGASEDHYEKETFIFNHSIVSNPVLKYKFKGFNKSIWEIDISERNSYLKLEDSTPCKNENFYKTEILANKIINHILHNKGKLYLDS